MPYATYFEFGKDSTGEVYQGLYIPPVTLQSGSLIVQPTYAFKRLSADRPRRVWDLHHNPGYTPTETPPVNARDLMLREIMQIDGLHVYITSVLIDPEWKTTGSFPVELSSTDLLALKDNPKKMPSMLNQRIKEQRLAKNFPALPEAS